MSDIVERLQDRAIVARNEGTGTGLGDAIHFEEAASTITALQERVKVLEGALRRVLEHPSNLYALDLARTALGEKK